MWAEHGQGFRSEYSPLFFGRELYQDLRKIKEAFDPGNKLNPGKIVTPYSLEDEVLPLESPLRGISTGRFRLPSVPGMMPPSTATAMAFVSTMIRSR